MKVEYDMPEYEEGAFERIWVLNSSGIWFHQDLDYCMSEMMFDFRFQSKRNNKLVDFIFKENGNKKQEELDRSIDYLFLIDFYAFLAQELSELNDSSLEEEALLGRVEGAGEVFSADEVDYSSIDSDLWQELTRSKQISRAVHRINKLLEIAEKELKKRTLENNPIPDFQELRSNLEEIQNQTKANQHRLLELDSAIEKVSQAEEESSPTQIQKLRYLHLTGLLPQLVEKNKRISGHNRANWDDIAHVVSRIIGEPQASIRKPIREHYSDINDRLEEFKSNEEVIGFLKAKKIR